MRSTLTTLMLVALVAVARADETAGGKSDGAPNSPTAFVSAMVHEAVKAHDHDALDRTDLTLTLLDAARRAGTDAISGSQDWSDWSVVGLRAASNTITVDYLVHGSGAHVSNDYVVVPVDGGAWKVNDITYHQGGRSVSLRNLGEGATASPMPAVKQAKPVPKTKRTLDALASLSGESALPNFTFAKSAPAADASDNVRYLSRVQEMIMNKVRQLPLLNGYHGKQVAVYFHINDQGSIISEEILKKSGRMDVDTMAMGAVKLASPFPVPPATAPRGLVWGSPGPSPLK